MPRRRRRVNKRNIGEIKEHGPGKWFVRWYCGRDARGKRVYKSKVITGSRMDALRLLASEQGKAPAETVEPETVGQFIHRWLTTILKLRVSAKTHGSYTGIMAPVKIALGDVRLPELTTEQLQGLLSGLAEAKSPRTVRYTITVLRAALDYAVHSKLLKENPARGPLAIPQRTRKQPTVWTVEQAHAFLAAAKAGVKLRGDWALWWLLYNTGLRPGEAFALTWADLDGNRLRITKAVTDDADGEYIIAVPKTQTGQRSVALASEHVAVLESLRQERGNAAGPDSFIFTREGRRGAAGHDNRHAARQRFTSAQTQVNKAREAKGLPALPVVHLYSLRHAHATALLRAGVNPKVIADRLGHASIQITIDTYQHVMPDLQESVIEAFARGSEPKPRKGAK